MKKVFLFICLLLLNACAAQNPLTDFRFQTVTAPPYVIASWYKIEAPQMPLRVYIEDDGQVDSSDNPTPTATFLRQMAADDPNPNVVYLGRPCQYLQAGACSQHDWTDGRYSRAVVDSMEEAVLYLMKKAKTQRVVLIGYGGGAQIAGLIAIRQPKDNVKVITIGGILDHRAWTKLKQEPSFEKSLNLANYKPEFLSLNQMHYVGEKDEVVPAILTEEFIQDKSQVKRVPNATHVKGWNRIAKDIYKDE